jgi:NAD(P)-dependent dehydrogenase (short-subunit alcohol dehydrogenase family)
MAGSALAGAGASVLLVDGGAALGHPEVAALRDRFGAKVEFLSLLPDTQSSCEGMVEHAITLFGRLDILLVTAGNNIARDALEMTPQEWDEVMNGHVRIAWLAARAAARHMIAAGNGGKIVLTSSIRGRLGLSGYSAYVPAKHAINGLARTLACEWGRYRINVNALAPILFRSDLTAWMFGDDERGIGVRNRMLERIPLGRLAEPSDFAGAILFLCTAASDFCTGQILYVDGGLTAC